MIGKANFADPKFSGFYQALADLKKNGYLNSDVASISFEQGFAALRPEEGRRCPGAPTATSPPGRSSSAAKAWASAPSRSGARASSRRATTRRSRRMPSSRSGRSIRARRRSSSMFLHSPQALKAWYEATGVFPADKRFPASLVTDPIAKKQLALDQSAVSVWPENFVPPQVDGNADLAAGELITSGSGSPADAVKLWESELSKWKTPAPGRVPGLHEVGLRGLNAMHCTRAPAAGGAGGGCSGPTSTCCPRSARWRSRSAFRSCRSCATASTRATSTRRSGSASTTTRASSTTRSSASRC